MGEVYRARDTRLVREVALKRLSAPALGSEVARRRVLREARAAAALSHPGIAAIYDVLESPDGLVIVMEYVPGVTLATRLRGGAMSVEEALEVGEQLADALSHAHANGVVHRDLKPANVMLTPAGRAKILDFGIAKSAAVDPEAGRDDLDTATGRVVGSPGYMAPEQLAGQPSDRRTDIYALGLLLFEMLTGARPYPAAGRLGQAFAMFDRPVPRADERAPHVPPAVAAIAARAMARSPSERFADADAFAAAVRSARSTLSNADTVLSSRTPARPSSRRGRRAWMIAIAAIVLGLAGAGIVWTRIDSPDVSARSFVVGVIPITSASADSEADVLAAGLTSALVQRLASLRSIRVLPLDETREAARTAKSPQAVANAVGAAYVVQGSLQRHGQTVEADMTLVGDDGHPRPAGRYAGEVDRLFDLHRRVAEGVAAALNQEGAVSGGVRPEAAPPTANQDAFADYSQARVFLDRPDVPGNLDHAIDLLRHAINLDNRFALAYAALGEAYWAQYRETKDPEWTLKAQEANLEALRIDPAQPEVRLSLAVMYEGTGRRDKAVEELGKVLELQPRSDSAHLVLSRMQADAGHWDAAIAEAKQAIALRPGFWRNHVQLGDTLMRAGRLEDAIAAFRRLVELQPDSPRSYQRLGTALQAAGRHEEAFQNYEKATKVGASWAAYSNMGTRYYWDGDFARAAEAYRRAIAMAPHEAELYANLGDALQRLGQKQQAADNYRRAVQEIRTLLGVKAEDPLNLASLALYEAKLGQKDAAAADIARAAALSPQDADVLYVRAIVHALAGKATAACNDTAAALARGKSAEEIRHTDEFAGLKGCAAYDGVMQEK